MKHPVYCECRDWEEGMLEITSAQMLAFNYGYRYKGKTFRFCPWCGKQLIAITLNQEERQCNRCFSYEKKLIPTEIDNNVQNLCENCHLELWRFCADR